MRVLTPDLCIIGAGSAGLSLAAGAAQLGLSVVLYEAGEMGGDCLNHGCVPSKALIAAAKRAQAFRTAEKFGIAPHEPQVDWAGVKAHVHEVIAAIAPNDSQERFEGLGVQVIREHARFTDARTVESPSTRTRARRFVIATGSRAAIPPIPGLDQVRVETNESIFSLEQFPEHLLILGAGPIGIEFGQAFRRLGARVTMVEAAKALAAADREAAEIVLAKLRAEGVEILEGWRATQAAPAPRGVALTIANAAGETRTLEGSHLLVAAGRAPNFAGLGLEAAGIAFDKRGISTSPTLRSTTNSHVWALGDAAGGAFTHTAGWHASAFVRNVLFKARATADSAIVPSVVYADPELAQIGLTEPEARAIHARDAKIVRWEFHDNDRAQTARETTGFCKLMLGKGGKILGATIVGAEAGELIAPLALAMANGLGARALTAPILPYPTRGEIWKRAAGAYFTPTLFSPASRFVVNLLQRIP